MVSSTAVTIDLARRARAAPATAANLPLAGALAAAATMFLRVGAIVAVFGPSLFGRLAAPLGIAAAVLLIAALALSAPWTRGEADAKAVTVGNPFEFRVVVGFAVALAAILVLSKALTANLGGEGGIALGAVAGLADVDAITLSMTQVGGAATPGEAVAAILTATVANSLSKSVLALTLGGRRFGPTYVAVTLVALGAGALAALLLPAPA
jgi:uncharacterized membrane protein (DUF4010 family)